MGRSLGIDDDKEEVVYLGTGVFMPKANIAEIKENTIHALIFGSVQLGKPVTYYTGAGWTLSGDFSSADSWREYLGTFSKRISSPIVVSIITK